MRTLAGNNRRLRPGLLPVALMLAALSLVGARLTAGMPADAASIPAANAADALRIGEQFETSRRWPEAIRHYEEALEQWPGDEDLKYAVRRTRVHFAIDRRYADRSFTDSLLARSRVAGLDQLEDVLARIQYEYVEPISSTRFIAHGTESLYMALANQRFLDSHRIEADSESLSRVRASLVRDYWNRRIGSRQEARLVVSEVAALTQQELGLNPSAVVAEYLFGGCNALDDYSGFLTPDRYKDLFGSMQGEFVGIGIEMEADRGRGLHLVNVMLDSPAEEGGLRPGDHIVAIDGRNCLDFSTDEAASLLRGLRGSRVQLTFESPTGVRNTETFVRRPVQVRSVTRVVMLDDADRVGYIRMSGFQSSTPDELDEALRSLQKQGMRSLIWDLRGNPGGLLETAAEVADRFISDGVLVITEGRSGEQNQVFRAHSYNTWDVPLVLLVDENSASASEIVAGAIRDHARGTIVGRKTYGKWSVQSIIHMPGGTGLKLTTAKFFSPHHNHFGKKGLAPHVAVHLPEGTSQTTFFRARTSDELLGDPDVSRGIEVLENRLAGTSPR